MDCAQLLSDPLWRIGHLYGIKTEDEGRRLRFTPRAEQWEVIRALTEHPDQPLYIIKSRRLGMSTALGITLADCAAWSSGFQGSLVDQTQADAERKMSEIIRYAVKSMPAELAERLEFPKANDGELQIVVRGQDARASSRIFAGKNARGGTNNFLWISEWGPIAANDPRRSTEIRTGALPSARRGRRVVETTWYGGKSGDLWDLVKPILERDPNAEGRVLFFPWHGDPACVRTTGVVTKELEEYFREAAEKVGRKFSREQKLWYGAKQLEQGMFVKREYPTTMEEAMTAPVEGSIYGEALARRRAAGAIGPVEPDAEALVNTSWDLGSPVNTVCWYFQVIGRELRFIDVDLDVDLTAAERVAGMLRKGYRFGWHYVPHDAAAKQYNGRTFAADLEDAGLKNLRIVPRTADEWVGINHVRQNVLPRAAFRLPQCEVAVGRLEAFRTARETSGGLAKDAPVHDINSHAAAALRTAGEADLAGMLEAGWVRSAFDGEGLKALRMGAGKVES